MEATQIKQVGVFCDTLCKAQDTRDVPFDLVIQLAIQSAPKAYFPITSPPSFDETYPLSNEESLGDTILMWPKDKEWPRSSNRTPMVYVGTWRDPRFDERPLVQLFVNDPRNWIRAADNSISNTLDDRGICLPIITAYPFIVVYDRCNVDTIYRKVLKTDQKMVFFEPYNVYNITRQDPIERSIIREWHTRPEISYDLLYWCSVFQEPNLTDNQRISQTEHRMAIIGKYDLGVSPKFKVGGYPCCMYQTDPDLVGTSKYVACNVLEDITKWNNLSLSVSDDSIGIIHRI